MIDCPHWSDCGIDGGGCCAVGKYGGRPSRGMCQLVCLGGKAAPQPSRGLGDTIAKITKAIGIKPCGGCKNRQAVLNKLVPYSARTKDPL